MISADHQPRKSPIQALRWEHVRDDIDRFFYDLKAAVHSGNASTLERSTEKESDQPHVNASEEIGTREEILQTREDPLCRLTEIFNGRVNSKGTSDLFIDSLIL